MSTKTLTQDDLSLLCWQLSLLARSGVAWTESASLLLEENQLPNVKAALETLRAPLVRGETLSAAMEETGLFPPYLLRMAEVGEASGRLDEVLKNLSHYYRSQAATLAAIRGAVTYPAVMAALLALVFLVLTARVLPVFARVFTQVGAGLSPVAATLLGTGPLGRTFVYVPVGILLVLSAVLLLFFRGERGLRLFSRGATAVALARSSFSSSMALMLRSGLPMAEALDRSASLLAGTPLESPFADCRRAMESGATFPQAVQTAGLLTPFQAGLLSAGFRSGAAEEAMDELARRCQEEAEGRLSKLLSRFSYALVSILCATVALVLLDLMLPLLGVMSAIGG